MTLNGWRGILRMLIIHLIKFFCPFFHSASFFVYRLHFVQRIGLFWNNRCILAFKWIQKDCAIRCDILFFFSSLDSLPLIILSSSQCFPQWNLCLMLYAVLVYLVPQAFKSARKEDLSIRRAQCKCTMYMMIWIDWEWKHSITFITMTCYYTFIIIKIHSLQRCKCK